MGSGKKGGGKCPVFVDDHDKMMMIQGLGEMNLDACDSGDWLMVNNDSGVRARNHNHPQVSVNQVQAPKAWGQPGMLNQHPNPWGQGQGQPPMLGRPRGPHEQVSWGNFHNTPTAGFVPRPPPPNFGSMKMNHNSMMGRNPVGLPPWSNGQGFNARGGYDGIRSNGGGKRPLVVVDSDDDDEEVEDEDEDEDEEGFSGSKAKNVTKSKTTSKGVQQQQSLTSGSWGQPGVGSKPYMNRNHGPSAASHPGVGYCGWRPVGGGMMPLPVSHLPPPLPPPPPPFPVPPSKFVGNFAAGDKKISSEKTVENIPKKNSFDDRDEENFDDDFDDEFDDDEDMISVEDEDAHKIWPNQTGLLVHGQMNRDPQLDMPPQLKHTWNLAHGGGSSQREAYCNPSYNNGKKSTIPHEADEEILKHRLAMEAYSKKHLPPPVLREGKPPNNSNPISGANPCKIGGKNAGKHVKFFFESESSDFKDEEESEFDDDANEVIPRPKFVGGKGEKSGKHKEVSFEVQQMSKIPKDSKKEVMQSRKHHKDQCGEATDGFAGEKLQMKAEKFSEQSNVQVSFFEDYKNRVKEVAKLVKLHITPKHEVDTCTTDKEQLMKIHEEKLEMKKRHQEEEQELEKKFAAALRRFMEKPTTVDVDSDASSEL